MKALGPLYVAEIMLRRWVTVSRSRWCELVLRTVMIIDFLVTELQPQRATCIMAVFLTIHFAAALPWL